MTQGRSGSGRRCSAMHGIVSATGEWSLANLSAAAWGESMPRLIDLRHLGRDRVIGAYELDGLIVDPGPSSCLERLIGGLGEKPRALLLTHIHLDHAGATGSLVKRF